MVPTRRVRTRAVLVLRFTGWKLSGKEGGARKRPASHDSSVVGSVVPLVGRLTARQRRIGFAAHHAFPHHPVELVRGTRSASEKSKSAVAFAQYSALCFGLTSPPRANGTPKPPGACASWVTFSTVDASATKFHLPEDLMSNTSVIGGWKAVFRFMCSVPRMSSMVRSALTWL